MRTVLGRLFALSVAGSTLFLGATAAGAGAPPDTTEPPVETTVETTEPAADPTVAPTPTTQPPAVAAPTPPTAAPATTATTTTTTQPPPPLVVEVPGPLVGRSPVAPQRGKQMQVTDTLPPPPTTTTTTLPPHDALPANSGSGRRVVYSKSKMRVWTVESNGHVSKTHLVSGRRTWNQPTPGTYSVFSRSSYTCNIKNNAICWRYMVRFTKGPGGDNIGFHEIPTDTRTGRKVQSISQLGTPLSAGCVRQAPWDAQYMWGWAPIGTKVVVLG